MKIKGIRNSLRYTSKSKVSISDLMIRHFFETNVCSLVPNANEEEMVNHWMEMYKEIIQQLPTGKKLVHFQLMMVIYIAWPIKTAVE